MINELIVRGFRGFRQFDLHGLGRVNLLVGTNNCGKTSILEAVQIFASSGDGSVLWQVASRRGERLFDGAESPRMALPEVDVNHLFHGHGIEPESDFEIKAQSEGSIDHFSATIVSRPRQRTLFDEELGTASADDDLVEDRAWALSLDWSAAIGGPIALPLSSRGGISRDSMRRYPRSRTNGSPPVRFISTAGLTVDDVVAMFEDIVLTQEEELVTDALRTVEDSIERLATVSGDRSAQHLGDQFLRRSYSGERGGIVVRCRGSSQRIPIGSMGDGTWRMLGLALALATAENGILLVDEIDTGLHFSVMEKMWKVVDAASRRLGVQVFATTHSRDCYESLAAISRESVSDGSDVTIQRVDSQKGKSVAFTEQEIVAAAERGTEVR